MAGRRGQNYDRRSTPSPEFEETHRRLQRQREEFMDKVKEKTLAKMEKLLPILEAAKEACKRLGGCASIDDRYVVVDTKYYQVTERQVVQLKNKEAQAGTSPRHIHAAARQG